MNFTWPWKWRSKEKVEEKREYAYETLPESNLTSDELLDLTGFGKFQFKLLLIVGLRVFAHGSSFALMTVISTSLQCQWSLSNFEKAFLTAAFFAGFAVGSFVCGIFADKYGRLRTMLLAYSFSAYYSSLSALAPSFYWMVILRFKFGIFVGGVSLGYLFLIEFMPRGYRRVVTSMDLFFGFGIVCVALQGATILHSIHWRLFIFIAEALPLTLATMFAMTVPESPRYLLAVGRTSDAEDIFNCILKENGCQCQKIRLKNNNFNQLNQGNGNKLCSVFSSKYLHNTLCFMFIWFAVSMSQVGTLYLTTEYNHIPNTLCKAKTANVDLQDPIACLYCKHLSLSDYINLMVTGLGGVPAFLVSYVAMEKIGRKLTVRGLLILILIMSSILVLCLPKWALVISFLVAYTSGYTCHLVLQVYVSEVYPTYMRGAANGFIKVFSRFGHIVGAFYAQYFMKMNFLISLTAFCALTFLACLLTFVLSQETNGKPLSDTEDSSSDAERMKLVTKEDDEDDDEENG
eukprot:gene9130-10103_t